MKHRLTRRLLLCFTGVLLVFALMTGGSFGYFYLNYMESHHVEDLKRLALNLAEDMKSRPETAVLTGTVQPAGSTANDGRPQERNGMGRGCRHGMMHHSMMTAPAENEQSPAPEAAAAPAAAGRSMHCRRTFSAASQPEASPMSGTSTDDAIAPALGQYLKNLNDFSNSEVWVLDAHSRNISLYGEESSLQYDEFPPAVDAMLQNVLEGETVTSRDFTPLLTVPSITVGTPIYGKDGEIAGALLLHRTLEELQSAQQQALLLFLLCLTGALAAASVLSLLLARRFLHPLQKMEHFAEELAAGNYDRQSGIHQKDEIGSLAESLDTLALRLEDARQEKTRLEKMRQDFLAGISHELRTPITVLRGTLELLSSGLVKDEEKQKNYLAQMTSNVLSLQRLVQDLFELARLQNADFRIELSDLNLADPLQDAVQAARQIAAPKQIEIRYDGTREPILLAGDYGRLRQMFLTVLDNAVKFSPEGKEITVRLSREKAQWELSVCDQGCGISEDELPHIFDRFQSRKDRKNREGTGLGLPIAREIARRHKISIRCESKEGQGTCFFFQGSSALP